MISLTLCSISVSPSSSKRIKDAQSFNFFQNTDDPIEPLKGYQEMAILGSKRGFSRLDFAPALKACSKASSLSFGKQIHAQSVKCGLSWDVFVQTSLVAMYSQCGQIEIALNVFDKMSHRNVVTWTTVMDSCIRSDRSEMALVAFRGMQRTGIRPDHYAIVSVLTACSRLGALNLGRWVHTYIERVGFEVTSFLGTALIDMYCKCGSVDEAYSVFDSMKGRSVHSWNAMIHGLSVHGRGAEALHLFETMRKYGGVRPNEVTFVGVLSGCSHSGLVEEGKMYFDLMRNECGIVPTIKHYGCMVDLLARAGLLDEAFDMASKISVSSNAVVWGALLSACRKQNDVVMAERISRMIAGIEDNCKQGDTSHYVIMSNMYAQAGLKDKMAEARAKVGKKPKGKSWIEIGCNVHEFAVGDCSHSMWGELKNMLEEIVEKSGMECEEQLEVLQNPHSEMSAVAFGLLTTRVPTTIRIVKNLRICSNCHEMMKLISKVYEREIIIRDCTRYHEFKGGYCTCRDYW
ncbi:hypothetical protein Syun_013086 [Stephania yunnanensis]|uniref:DYW domain-containing protein n=1 Tax=Stephania yunnanensis TaxID=152371 RepID=A0AAP0K0R0_9MAGN